MVRGVLELKCLCDRAHVSPPDKELAPLVAQTRRRRRASDTKCPAAKVFLCPQHTPFSSRNMASTSSSTPQVSGPRPVTLTKPLMVRRSPARACIVTSRVGRARLCCSELIVINSSSGVVQAGQGDARDTRVGPHRHVNVIRLDRRRPCHLRHRPRVPGHQLQDRQVRYLPVSSVLGPERLTESLPSSG